MRLFLPSLIALAASGLALAAEPPNAALARWVESQGGEIGRSADGKITEVSLARTWATDNDVQRLAELKDLKRLDLSLTYVSDRGIESLQKLTKLEDLNLFAAEFITDAAISFLRANKGLQRLNLGGTDVTDTSLQYVAELTGLKQLDVSQTQISDVGLDHLPALAQLEDLNLGGNKISGVSLNILKLLPKLKKLSFSGIQRRNAGLCWAPVVTDKELETISLLTSLEDLDIGWRVGLGNRDPALKGRPSTGEAECRIIGGTRVTDAGLAKLTALKQLRRLDISGAPITPSGIKRLESLQNLERLSIWNCELLDDTIAPTLAGLPNLRTVDLSYTSVGDATIQQLTRLTKLKEVYLTDTRVTAASADSLRSKPGVRVFWAQRPPARPTVAPVADRKGVPAKKDLP